MARPSVDLIIALRNTARKLKDSGNYQWGHMGLCNCGFLVQEITHLRKEEIHASAMERAGDWSEQLNDYCPSSGLPMDDLITQMLSFGIDTEDLKHLERLSSPLVLHQLPFEERNLHHNVKKDVIIYLNAWADHIESQLLENITLPDVSGETAEISDYPQVVT